MQQRKKGATRRRSPKKPKQRDDGLQVQRQTCCASVERPCWVESDWGRAPNASHYRHRRCDGTARKESSDENVNWPRMHSTVVLGVAGAASLR
jgi:hypothetical protein